MPQFDENCDCEGLYICPNCYKESITEYKQKGQNIKLEDKVCPVCKCLIFSKSKQRPVLCECQWKQMEILKGDLKDEKNN